MRKDIIQHHLFQVFNSFFVQQTRSLVRLHFRYLLKGMLTVEMSFMVWFRFYTMQSVTPCNVTSVLFNVMCENRIDFQESFFGPQVCQPIFCTLLLRKLQNISEGDLLDGRMMYFKCHCLFCESNPCDINNKFIYCLKGL